MENELKNTITDMKNSVKESSHRLYQKKEPANLKNQLK